MNSYNEIVKPRLLCVMTLTLKYAFVNVRYYTFSFQGIDQILCILLPVLELNQSTSQA